MHKTTTTIQFSDTGTTEDAGARPDFSLHDMTVFRLYRAWSSANPIFVRLCEGRFNITRREWRILATVVGFDALPSSDVARLAELDPARTSRTITTLASKGWVTRQRDGQNARTVLISATAAGRTVYARIVPEITRLNKILTADLSKDELSILHNALDILARRANLVLESNLVKDRARRGGSYRETC